MGCEAGPCKTGPAGHQPSISVSRGQVFRGTSFILITVLLPVLNK